MATALKQADSALLVLEWEPLEWEFELLDAAVASEQIPLFRPGPRVRYAECTIRVNGERNSDSRTLCFVVIFIEYF